MRAWLEINLDVIARNYRYARAFLGDRTRVMAVVKADAYGHGIEPVVRVLERENCPMYAVISLDEAKRVRTESAKDILIMGFVDDAEIQEAIREGFILSLYDRSHVDLLHELATRVGIPLRVHLKVETGMNRLGMQISEAIEFLSLRAHFPMIQVESVFTHLAMSSTREVNLEQLANFRLMIEAMGEMGVSVPIHMTNSHGVKPFPEGHFDYVRLGLTLYGVEPVLPGLEPSLTAKTVVMQKKPLRKGESTSYSKLFTAPHDMEIAILAMGYAEGLSQSMTNKINCIVSGIKTPLVGQICMNLCIADVTNIPAQRGDEVVIIGKQGKEEIRVADIAQQTGIRHHEVMTRLGKSIPKVYLGEPVQTVDRVRAPEIG